ncbi:MAG: hypothetical protein ACX939_05265 [Hyphococcus sp.]
MAKVYKQSEMALNEAVAIEKYWAARGYQISVEIVPVRTQSDKGAAITVYEIQTDLFNGLPRDYRGDGSDIRPLRPVRLPMDTAAIRKCLSCDGSFYSSHRHNRICQTCRDRIAGSAVG